MPTGAPPELYVFNKTSQGVLGFDAISRNTQGQLAYAIIVDISIDPRFLCEARGREAFIALEREIVNILARERLAFESVKMFVIKEARNSDKFEVSVRKELIEEARGRIALEAEPRDMVIIARNMEDLESKINDYDNLSRQRGLSLEPSLERC